MRIHIIGICGTFMGSLALIAKQLGHEVTGSDKHVYPPMSDLLFEQGIDIWEGFEESHLSHKPDCIIIGNASKRGDMAIEYILNHALPYTSGPQWLAENVLHDRWVMAVAGTHGKTTTTSMLAWILEHAGLNPSFLIGGVPQNFPVSARVTNSPFFVIEADEYDTAFFDKRSKFLHYRPRTLILNNLEFDHADIFPNLNAIKTQFHHLVRTIPSNGLIVTPATDENLADVLEAGCWTPAELVSFDFGHWVAKDIAADGSAFDLQHEGTVCGRVEWSLIGKYNVLNALAAVGAAKHAGVPVNVAVDALNSFQGVKRRLEVRGTVNGITVYDDFAHHPTAVASTLEALRNRVGDQRILAVLECGSYTMRQGVHGDKLIEALSAADNIFLARPEHTKFNIDESLSERFTLYTQFDEIVEDVIATANAGDHILIMSNRGFDGIHEKILAQLTAERQRPV